MDEEKPRIKIALIFSLLFVIVIWLVRLFEMYTKIDLSVYGVYPKTAKGLSGILTSPLIHADLSHIASNTLPIFLLTTGLFYLYTKSALKVFMIIYIFHGLGVWLFGRQSYHIGASGIIYGLAAFLFFIGLFRKDSSSIGLSLLVVFLYGSLVWGILPTDPAISYEAHLSGAFAGIVCSIIFRKADPPVEKKYKWDNEEENENEEQDINPDDIKISDDAHPVWFDRK